MTHDETQVLTFSLGEEQYCVDIDYVAEIVDSQDVTSVPNANSHIKGVTDLRGQTTTIVDPSELLNIDADELRTDGGRTQNRIIVLDADSLGAETTTGWLVSDVNEVLQVAEESVDVESIGDTDLLRGLLKEDEEFTLWLDPDEFTA